METSPTLNRTGLILLSKLQALPRLLMKQRLNSINLDLSIVLSWCINCCQIKPLFLLSFCKNPKLFKCYLLSCMPIKNLFYSFEISRLLHWKNAGQRNERKKILDITASPRNLLSRHQLITRKKSNLLVFIGT